MPILPWEKSWKYFLATPWICNWWYFHYSEFPNHFHLVPTSRRGIKKVWIDVTISQPKNFCFVSKILPLGRSKKWVFSSSLQTVEHQLLPFSILFSPNSPCICQCLMWSAYKSFYLRFAYVTPRYFVYIVYVFLVILLGILLNNINPLVDLT